MIISLFGPDGVGKSTFAKTLEKGTSLPVISGTDPSTWQDTSWHQSFVDLDINEREIKDIDHIYEKIRRAHQEAVRIDQQGAGVIVDSDPLHKTFLHSVMLGREMAGLVQQLEALDAATTTGERLHIHVRLSRRGTPQQHAELLQDRLNARGFQSIFDPTTAEASLAMLDASEKLDQQLRATGHKVVSVYNDTPFFKS